MTNDFLEKNPDFRWRVASEAREGQAGEGHVVITIESERFGRHTFTANVDWPAGGELIDVERDGLTIAFGAVTALADALARRKAEIEV